MAKFFFSFVFLHSQRTLGNTQRHIFQRFDESVASPNISGDDGFAKLFTRQLTMKRGPVSSDYLLREHRAIYRPLNYERILLRLFADDKSISYSKLYTLYSESLFRLIATETRPCGSDLDRCCCVSEFRLFMSRSWPEKRWRVEISLSTHIDNTFIDLSVRNKYLSNRTTTIEDLIAYYRLQTAFVYSSVRPSYFFTKFKSRVFHTTPRVDKKRKK